ncbi:MAG: Rossmann-like and DUF2520 domain-containing protein [candidate division WOR-3 bacterium]
MKKKNYQISFLGTGCVGTAFAYHLQKQGYQIIGGFDINKHKLRRFYQLLKIKYQIPTLPELIRTSNLVFITTPDAEIKKTYQKIFPYLNRQTIVIHCSGALDTKIFYSAKEKKLIPIGIHPIQTFTTISQSIKSITNIYFGIEANSKAKAIANEIVLALKGKSIFIKSQDKPLYHTMCVFVSNYLVVLISIVSNIARELKIKPKNELRVLWPLINQTLTNISKFDPKKALTGPIVRGDLITIKSHLKVLKKRFPELISLYKLMAKQAHLLLTRK